MSDDILQNRSLEQTQAEIRSKAIEQDVKDVKKQIDDVLKSLYPTYEDRTGFGDFSRAALTGLLEGLAEKDPALVRRILQGGRYETVDQLINALKTVRDPETGRTLLEAPGANLFIEAATAVPQMRHVFVQEQELGRITQEMLRAAGQRTRISDAFKVSLTNEEREKVVNDIHKNVFKAIEKERKSGTEEQKAAANAFIERLKADPTTRDLIKKEKDWLFREKETFDYSKLTWDRLQTLPQDVQRALMRSPEFGALVQKTNAAYLLLQTARGTQIVGEIRNIAGQPVDVNEALLLGSSLLGGNVAQYSPEEARARLAGFGYLARETGMTLSDIVQSSITAQQVASRYGLTGKIGSTVARAVLEQEAAYRKAGLTTGAAGGLPDERVRAQINAERISRGIKSEYAGKAALLTYLYKSGRLDHKANPRLYQLAVAVAGGGVAGGGMNLLDIDTDSLVEMASQATHMNAETLYGLAGSQEFKSRMLSESPGAMQSLMEAQRLELKRDIGEEGLSSIQGILENRGLLDKVQKDKGALAAIQQAAIDALFAPEALEATDYVKKQEIRTKKFLEYLKGGGYGAKIDLDTGTAHEIMLALETSAGQLAENDIYQNSDMLLAAAGLEQQQREISARRRKIEATEIGGEAGRQFVRDQQAFVENERVAYNTGQQPKEAPTLPPLPPVGSQPAPPPPAPAAPAPPPTTPPVAPPGGGLSRVAPAPSPIGEQGFNLAQTAPTEGTPPASWEVYPYQATTPTELARIGQASAPGTLRQAPTLGEFAATETESQDKQPVVIKADALYIRVSGDNSAVVSSQANETYIG